MGCFGIVLFSGIFLSWLLWPIAYELNAVICLVSRAELKCSQPKCFIKEAKDKVDMAEESVSKELEGVNSKLPNWRYFIIWVLIGFAPLIPLLLSQPILIIYDCHGGLNSVSCADAGWALRLANAVYGIESLILFTGPLAIVAFIVGIIRFIRYSLFE